jgi:hypothetical protein
MSGPFCGRFALSLQIVPQQVADVFTTHSGGVMSKHIRIQLTEEQKKQVQDATGRNGEALELTVEELEERIAPGGIRPKL